MWEVRKPGNKYEAAETLLGSERPFGQVHSLWKVLDWKERTEMVKVADDDGDGSDEEEEDEDEVAIATMALDRLIRVVANRH